MENIESYISGFKTKLIEEKKETETIKYYCLEIQYFLKKLKTTKFIKLNRQDVLTYRDSLLDEGYSISTVNKSMSVINKFLHWAKSEQIIDHESLFDLRIIHDRGETIEKAKWITVAQENQLIQSVEQERNEMKRTRNLLLISLMLHLGLRLEEVALIKMSDINNDTIEIPNSRTLQLPEITKKYLSNWLEVRRLNQPFANHLSLFYTERSPVMQPRAIQFVIERYSKKNELPLTAQMLRHTYCRRLVEEGLPIQAIKKLAGHKSVQTTSMYFT